MAAEPWRPSILVDQFMALTRDQQEFFMSLLPNWHFTIDELLEATVALCD